MRHFLSLFIGVFCLFFTVLSQSDSVFFDPKYKHCNYASIDARISSMNGMSVGYNYLYNESFSARLEIGMGMKKPDDLPADYSSSLFGSAPRNSTLSFLVLTGFVADLSGNGKIRVNFQAGLGMLRIIRHHDWKKLNHTGFENVVYDNYAHETTTLTVPCFAIAPRIEISFIPYFGLAITPIAIFNSDKNFFGAQIGIMGGKIRRK